MLNGLAKIKDENGELYYIGYNYNNDERFTIWEKKNLIDGDGVDFSKEVIRKLLADGNIVIVNDNNNVFKNIQ